MDNTATLQAILDSIKEDPRYLRNIEYGTRRPGHSEGAVKHHIAELERNLEALEKSYQLTPSERLKLRILIHVHDSFKAESGRDLPILHEKSHASIARAYGFESLYGVRDYRCLYGEQRQRGDHVAGSRDEKASS
jgi:hypothetical protein